MHKNYLRIPAIIILFIGLNAAAQDEKAAAILDDFSSLVKTAPSVSIDFKFIVSDLRDGSSEETEGTIVMRGTKYRLETMEMVSWFDGSSVYTYIPDVKELIISDPDDNGNILSNPVNLFNIYKEEFRYRLIGETVHSGKTLYEIDLHPNDIDEVFHTIKLFIRKDNRRLHSAVMAAKDGTRYTLLVEDFSDQRNLPDDYFSFSRQDYPGVEIIDMRW